MTERMLTPHGQRNKVVRYVVDHLNHDDLVGRPGGIEEGPFDGATYGRTDGAWRRVLPLTGGELSGPLGVPSGTQASPGVGFGAADGTGVSRAGAALLFSVLNAPSLGLFANGGQFYGPLTMLNFPIRQVADPTAATDAVNLRTGDARYAPIGSGGLGAWQVFPADAGWVSTLRYRTLPGGLQIDGAAAGPLPANARGRIGVLPAGFRPTRQQRFPGVVLVPLATYGAGVVEVEPDGQVWTVWSIAGTDSALSVCAVLALD